MAVAEPGAAAEPEPVDAEQDPEPLLQPADAAGVRASLPRLHEPRAMMEGVAARIEASMIKAGSSIGVVAGFRGCASVLIGAYLQAFAVNAAGSQLPPRDAQAVLRLSVKMCRNDAERELWGSCLQQVDQIFGQAFEASVAAAEIRVLRLLGFRGARGLVKLFAS